MNCTDCMRPARRRRKELSVTPSTGSGGQPLPQCLHHAQSRGGAQAPPPSTPGSVRLAAQPFAGVPVVIKDNMCTTRLRTTCGSRILGNYIPPYTATAVRNPKRPGDHHRQVNLEAPVRIRSSTEDPASGRCAIPSTTLMSRAAARAVRPLPSRPAMFHSLGSDTGGSIRPGFILRDCRLEAHLRARLALWPGRLRLFARSRSGRSPTPCVTRRARSA